MKRTPLEPISRRTRRAGGRACLSTLAALTSCALASCSSAPPPPPQITVKPPQVAVAPEPPPLPPARWVDSSGATLIGPVLPSGTLVLLGGRRALVTKDGATRAETAPAPEGLLEIIEVPGAKGDLRIVGRGARGIYRFDDPLGPAAPLARSEALIDHIGAGPGLVAVWDFQSYTPRFIDVETGQPKALAGLPALPARAMAFRSAKEGAAAFEAAGLAITTDGGASWRIADDAGSRDALRVTGLRFDQGAVKAFVYSNGPSAKIDFANGKLEPMRDAREAAPEAAILKWIRVTERDPLDAAAASGVEAPGGAAIVASHGLLARVDTKTGAIGEIVEFAKGFGLTPCALTRSGRSAWLGCTLSEDDSGDFSDPFGVLRVQLSGPSLALDRPGFRRSGEAELRASPSGGLLVLAACSPDDEGDVCVRQPDGSWQTLSVKADLWKSGVGPLADGRAAFVRGLEEGDEAADDTDESESPKGEGEEGAAKNRLFVVAVDRSGKERRIATLGVSRGDHDLRAQSAIEEDDDHTLRLVLADEEGIYAVVQHPDQEGAAPQRIPQASHARIHAGRGMAIGEGRVMASADGGSTWIEAPAPTRVREALADVSGGLIEEPGVFAVSEIGAKMDTQLRIGWGQADAATEPRAADPPATLGPRPQPQLAPERTLSCTTSGAAQGTAPFTGAYEAPKLFKVAKAPGAKPVKGKRAQTSQAALGRAGLLDASAILEEQGTDKPGDAPKTWSIQWIDPSEVGAKVRTWSGPAPKDAAWGTVLRSAAAGGGRALFSLRTGGKFLLMRVKPSGAAEMMSIDISLAPTGEVEFGAEKSDMIAWVHDNSIVIWLPGEAPRIIATIGGRSTRALGQPSKDGVPILLSFSDLALMSVLPIPPMPKGAPGQKTAPPPPPPIAIPLDGWSPVTNIVRRDVTRLSTCGAKPKGARFVFTARQLNLKVDGADHSLQDALYEAVMAPGEACVSSVAALVAPARRIPAPAAAPIKSKPPKPAAVAGAQPGPVAWLRVDFAGKRAEGGERGVPGSARKLTCALDAKP